MNTDFIKAFTLIKIRMLKGGLTYENAKKEAEPLIEEMNAISAKIAKLYGRKPQKFNFSKLIR